MCLNSVWTQRGLTRRNVICGEFYIRKRRGVGVVRIKRDVYLLSNWGGVAGGKTLQIVLLFK
jgi:hypothetical protein